jgi:copper homeostasis protein
MNIEICANSYASAVAAQEGGANRIELCIELSVGGLTPSHGLIEKVISDLTIPVHVLIRPRSGDFTYTDAEIDCMVRDIMYCKTLKCAGIVSGVLTSENEVDEKTMDRLITASEGMEFTFHRAFDWCDEPLKQLKKLQKLGIQRLLSSGQKSKAIEGIELLRQLKNASEATLEIMPGGGINIHNILRFRDAGFKSVHFSATIQKQLLNKAPRVSMHSPAFFTEGMLMETDSDLIKKMIAKIQPPN